MLTVSLTQAIPGPVIPRPIPSNLYAGFKEEFASFFDNSLLRYEWDNMQACPSEDELNYLLSLAENFGPFFL